MVLVVQAFQVEELRGEQMVALDFAVEIDCLAALTISTYIFIYGYAYFITIEPNRQSIRTNSPPLQHKSRSR